MVSMVVCANMAKSLSAGQPAQEGTHLGDLVLEQLHYDAAGRCAADGDVEENMGV